MNMKTTLYSVLSSTNSHKRDRRIKFFEEEHKYTITTDSNSVYTSVTTWLHSHFPKFDADQIIENMMSGVSWKKGHKYWGMTVEEIKLQWSETGSASANLGTDVHYEIECFMNNTNLKPNYTHKELYEDYMSKENKLKEMTLEWQYFIEFVKDTPELKPYRTEWKVFYEEYKLAGSIDMIYENPDGTISIYDWKRSKNITRINYFNKFALTKEICHIPDSNYWHYALQLNTYKFILERKYGKTVKDLYLVRLHPDAKEKSYELIELPDLTLDIEDLFEQRRINL